MSCIYTTQGVLVCPRSGANSHTTKNKENTAFVKEDFFIEEKQNMPASKNSLFDMSKYCEVMAIKDPDTNVTSYSFKECPSN